MPPGQVSARPRRTPAARKQPANRAEQPADCLVSMTDRALWSAARRSVRLSPPARECKLFNPPAARDTKRIRRRGTMTLIGLCPGRGGPPAQQPKKTTKEQESCGSELSAQG